MANHDEQLEEFLNHIPLSIIGIGDKGLIKSWNDQAEIVFGWKKHEILNQEFTKLIKLSPSQELERLKQALLVEEAKCSNQIFELIAIHRNGSEFPIKISVTSLNINQTYLCHIFVNDLHSQQQQQIKQIKQTEENFSLLVDGIKDYAIYWINPAGYIVSWNSGAERIKGYKAHEVIGKHFSMFYPKQDIDQGKPQYELKVAIADGKFEEESWRVRKDGSLFWAHAVITPIWDEKGQLKGFAKITRDLTSRRLIEEALHQTEERYRLLIDSIPDYAIFMLDTKGRIVSWNSGAERIKGYRAEEIIGEHFSCFYTKEDARTGRPNLGLKIAAEKGRFEDVGWRVKKDGTRFWAHVIINAIRDDYGHFSGFSKVTRDLTEHQKMSEAERALKLRDEFLSIAAHELKTPLTTLKLQLQLVQQDVSSEPSRMPSQKALIKIFDDCLRWVNSLTNLVNELLDVSRIRSGNFILKLEKVNLSSLMQEIVGHYKPQLIAAKCPSVEFDLDPNVVIECDRNRIEQVIVNLISNIIKHAPGSLINISIGFKNKDKDRAMLVIQDFGPGIAKEHQAKVFQRFEQATASSAGLGLGLYITKGIIEAHQGTILLESELGKGTSFIIELPIKPIENEY